MPERWKWDGTIIEDYKGIEWYGVDVGWTNLSLKNGMERSGLEWERTNNILEDGMERNGLELNVIWFLNMKWIRMECN